MKLLQERLEECNIIVEAALENTPRRYYIQGIWIQSEIQNKNGRYYPKANIKPEIDRYIREDISGSRALGEFGHPDVPSINPDNVSHKILSLEEDGNNWVGKALILDSPTQGGKVKVWIDNGIQISVSTRALGSLVNKNGVDIVQPDFRLMTAGDIVVTPSAPDALMTALRESREWLWEESGIRELTLDTEKKRIMNAKSGRSLEEARIHSLGILIEELNKFKVRKN